MVKFVAKKGVNFDTLDEIDVLLDGKIANKKLDSFTVKDGNVKLLVEGSNFFYLGGAPVSGKISDIDVKINGSLAYSISKLNLKISDAVDFKNAEKALKEILKKDDKIIGSNEDDFLIGFKGDDTIKGKDGDDELLGDKGDDNLKGGDGEDLLDGGKNDDKLNGGDGLDTYQFTAAPGKGVDTITNFEAGETIALDNKVFDVGSEGPLDPDLFINGSDATTPDHRIVYKDGAGKIYYDPDGVGGDAKKLFAIVDPGTSLDAGDFMVI